ncbi:DUF3450 domain-containing protein [Halomonas pacifica]|nr:DUF3450 domain-containing protein [Halomonas pacifica]MDC8804305.1 DUF3450 domain-containing protein [Halomonas pacifica]
MNRTAIAAWRIRGLAGLMGLALSLPVLATTPLDTHLEAQQAQAALQERIDAADDESRAMLEELRRLEGETRRLRLENQRLAPGLETRAERLDRREAALEALADTRQALPELQQALIERLAAWVDADLPFLVEQRRGRVEALRASLTDPDLDDAERLERILAAWRAELDYGREMDAWRGTLDAGEARREVDFLRLGRVGLYYLTPDGRQGGVWLAEPGRWDALDDAQRRQVRQGLRMARDQRAPELLRLPVSQPLEDDA